MARLQQLADELCVPKVDPRRTTHEEEGILAMAEEEEWPWGEGQGGLRSCPQLARCPKIDWRAFHTPKGLFVSFDSGGGGGGGGLSFSGGGSKR